MGEIMGMTDSQYKDFVESVKEDLEELNEYKEAGDDAGYEKKYERIMKRFEKSFVMNTHSYHNFLTEHYNNYLVFK